MSKQIPDTAQANAALSTAREASRKDHLPYDVRHLDEIEWETLTSGVPFTKRPSEKIIT